MTGHVDRVHYLELVLDHDRRRVTRAPGQFVDLGGNFRLWQVLVALAKRYDAYYSTSDLISAVWEGYPAEEGTVWGAMTDLRKMLRPLDLTVKHFWKLGYRLEDLRVR